MAQICSHILRSVEISTKCQLKPLHISYGRFLVLHSVNTGISALVGHMCCNWIASQFNEHEAVNFEIDSVISISHLNKYTQKMHTHTHKLIRKKGFSKWIDVIVFSDALRFGCSEKSTWNAK